MKGKRGGIIALEPSTGEILALITSPNYDPNMMVGRARSPNSVKLIGDTINKPMYDRGLKGTYAPGSPFKLVNALIGCFRKKLLMKRHISIAMVGIVMVIVKKNL